MKPLIETFERYAVPEPMSGCWLWTGVVNADGYGGMWRGNNYTSAHRFSWAHHRGEIPDGIQVLHKCDVPSCCNPDHLFLGTRSDNMRDSFAKGRRGIQKITKDIALIIRAHKGNHREMAERYGIGITQVSRIKLGKRWGWVK